MVMLLGHAQNYGHEGMLSMMLVPCQSRTVQRHALCVQSFHTFCTSYHHNTFMCSAKHQTKEDLTCASIDDTPLVTQAKTSTIWQLISAFAWTVC